MVSAHFQSVSLGKMHRRIKSDKYIMSTLKAGLCFACLTESTLWCTVLGGTVLVHFPSLIWFAFLVNLFIQNYHHEMLNFEIRTLITAIK